MYCNNKLILIHWLIIEWVYLQVWMTSWLFIIVRGWRRYPLKSPHYDIQTHYSSFFSLPCTLNITAYLSVKKCMCTLKVIRPTASQHTVYLTLKEYIRYIYNWNWNLTSPLTIYTYGNNRLHDVCSCFIKRLGYKLLLLLYSHKNDSHVVWTTYYLQHLINISIFYLLSVLYLQYK